MSRNCQFVTAAYATYDLRQRELCLARAGHPYPLHVRADGQIEPIIGAGGLLGLPDLPCEFQEVRLTLAPGEKLLLYTDGLEDDFFEPGGPQAEIGEIAPALREWAALPVPVLVETLREHLDGKEGSLNPADDATLLACEVA